ncbi:MAG: hypothetical protein WBW71_15225 [Bacteroidota bacterium]
MTHASPEPLGNVIDALMAQLGLQTKLKQYDIVGLWPSMKTFFWFVRES